MADSSGNTGDRTRRRIALRLLPFTFLLCQSHGAQFRRVNRLGIEIKSGARFGVAKQALNRLHVFALVDKKGREAVAEVVKAESLTVFEPDANLNRGWANFILCHHAGTQRRSALHLCGGENPIVWVRIERLPMPASEVSERDRSG